jgi:hypothetical protein
VVGRRPVEKTSHRAGYADYVVVVPSLTPVVSSNLVAVGYDGQYGCLYVEFWNGSLYCYEGVPVSVYRALMTAPSHGEFLDGYVKKAGYPYSRLA